MYDRNGWAGLVKSKRNLPKYGNKMWFFQGITLM
jgi:hypothetical protein